MNKSVKYNNVDEVKRQDQVELRQDQIELNQR
mgnify:CR=1 FL=1